MTNTNPYRDLPSVDVLTSEIVSTLPRPIVVDLARVALEQARNDIKDGRVVDARMIADQMVRRAERNGGVSLINATGVLLHTNLGRARWSRRAIDRAAETASQPTNLEIDVDTGERRRRGAHVSSLLRSLTGAEDALIVNNNASALLLALAATAAGFAVPVARGELIEIGGSYRLPDVMQASGARLVEVGTTNRTRLGDYQAALQVNRCGAVLKVHPSNYRVEGFTETTPANELARLARDAGIPMIYDTGSGHLDAATPWLDGPPPAWLANEPAAKQALEDGVDLVTFSGDKLLGGPQAGVIVGTSDAVARLRSHPLARALRVDGVTYTALAATLEAYLEGSVEEIPFWRQALLPHDALAQRAEQLASDIGASVSEGTSTVGAGSVPGVGIPSPLVVLEDEDHLFEALLAREVPVLTRREAGSLIIDLRTVDPAQDDIISEAISRCR